MGGGWERACGCIMAPGDNITNFDFLPYPISMIIMNLIKVWRDWNGNKKYMNCNIWPQILRHLDQLHSFYSSGIKLVCNQDWSCASFSTPTLTSIRSHYWQSCHEYGKSSLSGESLGYWGSTLASASNVLILVRIPPSLTLWGLRTSNSCQMMDLA